MTTPQTAQQINDPQTGQVRTSRHSALSELMIQNAELREQLRVLQSAYDSLSQMKEKQVASRIETDELRAENEDLKADNARLAAQEQIKIPQSLSPITVVLVLKFAEALADKLSVAEKKHGYGDSWATPDAEDWPDPLCYQKLIEHLGKGDPRDVAAYCAFLWFHNLSTQKALSYLLAPTIELLLKIRPTAQYQCFHAIVEDLDKELDRLRGLVEGKP